LSNTILAIQSYYNVLFPREICNFSGKQTRTYRNQKLNVARHLVYSIYGGKKRKSEVLLSFAYSKDLLFRYRDKFPYVFFGTSGRNSDGKSTISLFNVVDFKCMLNSFWTISQNKKCYESQCIRTM